MPSQVSRHAMHRAWLGLLAFLVVFTSCPVSAAQSGPPFWSKLILEGYKQQNLPKLLAAVELAEKFGEDDPRLHIALYDAGSIASWQNKNPAIAENLLKRDIANLEKISVNFPDIVADCYELANVYETEGKYEEAESVLLRAVALRKYWEDLQSDDPYNAELYTSLYIAYYAKGDNTKAAEAKSQLLGSVALWHTTKTRALCLFKVDNDLYKYATRCKQLDPAKKKYLLEMALGFSLESAGCWKKFGEEYEELTSTMNVGECYMALGRFVEAENVFRRVLSISEGDLATENGNAFSTLAQLATILCSQHRIDEVEQLQNEYLSKVAKQFGENSKTYAEDVRMCGEMWGNEKYPELAAKRWKQAAAIKKRSNKT